MTFPVESVYAGNSSKEHPLKEMKMKITASMLRPGMRITGRYEGLRVSPRIIEGVVKHSTEVQVWFEETDEFGSYANLNPNTVVEVHDVPAGVEQQYCRKSGNILLRTTNPLLVGVMQIIATHNVELDCSGWAYYRKNGNFVSAGLDPFFAEVSLLERKGLIDVSYSDIRLTDEGSKCWEACKFLKS